MKRLIPVFVVAVALFAGCSGSALKPGPAGARPAAPEIPGLSPSAVVIQAAKFDPGQLGRWYDAINQHTAAVQGIVISDVDERVNRIRYAVTTIEARQRLEEAIRKAGVPLEAVIIDLPAGALSEAEPLKGCLVEERPRWAIGKVVAGHYSLELQPETPRVGHEFTIDVAGAVLHELTRGVDAYLECWDGAAWTPRYTLWSHDPPTASIYSPNRVIDGVGFDASLPGRFILPDGLKPGWYRVRLQAHGRVVDGALPSYDLWTLVQIEP